MKLYLSKAGLVGIGLVFGFALGCGLCLRRSAMYFWVRGIYDEVRSVCQLLPKQVEEKPPIYLLGDSLVRRGRWTGLEDQFAVVNLGQGGSRVRDVLRLVEETPDIANAHALVLVGINEFADRAALEAIREDYEALIALLKKRALEITVLSIPEIRGGGALDRRPAIRLLNQQLEHVSKQMNVSWIDLNRVLSDERGVKYGYLTDDLHLTLKAYQDLEKILQR